MGQAWLIVEPYCTLVFVLVSVWVLNAHSCEDNADDAHPSWHHAQLIPFFPKSVASGSQEWIEPRGGEDLQ